MSHTQALALGLRSRIDIGGGNRTHALGGVMFSSFREKGCGSGCAQGEPAKRSKALRNPTADPLKPSAGVWSREFWRPLPRHNELVPRNSALTIISMGQES